MSELFGNEVTQRLVRNIVAGYNVIASNDKYLAYDRTDGDVILFLPKISDFMDAIYKNGSSINLQIYLSDVTETVSANIFTLICATGDNINGRDSFLSSTLNKSTNKFVLNITPSGWLLSGINPFENIKQVVITRIEDFPAPILSVINLKDNTDYVIQGAINIGLNTIKVGQNNSIVGTDRFTDILISNTSGIMINIGSAAPPFSALICNKITLQCPNGTLFNSLNQGITLDFCVVSNTKNIGVFTSVINSVSLAILTTNFSNITNNGFILNGNLGVNVRVLDCVISNIKGTFLDLNTSVSKFILISRNIVTSNATQTFLSGTTGGDNVTVSGKISNNIFTGLGNYISVIQPSDPRWSFSDNEGVADSFSESIDFFTPSSLQVVFNLSNPINLNCKPILLINGQEQRYNSDYTIVNNVLTWISNDYSLTTTDKLDVYY